MAEQEERLVLRTVPHAKEAEESVIGAMIRDQDAVMTALEILVPEDFYNRQYHILFDAMREMSSEGVTIDFVSLQERLRRKKDVPPEFFLWKPLEIWQFPFPV